MEKLLGFILYAVCIGTMSLSQGYCIHFTSKLLCKEKYNIKKLLITSACIIPLSMFSQWSYFETKLPVIIKSVITILMLLFYTYLFYRPNALQTTIITVISIIIPFVFEILLVFFVSIFLNGVIDMTEITSTKKLYYIATMSTNTITLATLKLIDYLINKKKFIYINNSVNIKNIDYRIIIYHATIIILSLTPTMFLITSKSYNYPLSFIFVNTAQLIIVSIFSFLYVKKRILFKDTELELENTKLHNQALSTINENIRGFKHDMGNMVQSINGYLAVGNIEGVKDYCKNLLHGFNDINLLSILSPKIINDPAIYGIVVSKMLYARENNLTLSLDIGLDVSQINFPSFELSRIIGILLDNAIEASLESNDKKLKLEMYHDENRKYDVIIIGNSVKDANSLNIIKMFEKNYSTKENPSGFGLYEVLKFFKKNNKGDIVPNIDYDTNFFTQTVTFDR